MLWYVLGGLVIYIIFVKIYKRHTYWHKYDVLQSSAKTILNMLMELIFRKKSFFDQTFDYYNEYPDKRYNGSYQFLHPVLIVRDLDLIKQITVKDFDSFVDHYNRVDENVDPLFGKNLFSLTGKRWHEMRTTLSPAFTSSKMRSMFVLMVECAEQFSQHFDKMNIVNIKDVFRLYTNDVIASAAFGVKVDSLKDPMNEFHLNGKEAVNMGLKFVMYTAFPDLMVALNIPLFSRKVTSFFRGIVKDTITTREKQGIVRPDMIHLLMEARKGRLKHEAVTTADERDAGFATVEESQIGKAEAYKKIELTDVDIAAQALLFFFAGFEGLATTLSFVAYELAVNPDVQKQLQEEIDKTFEICHGKITYEEILKMKYLDQVISETLRLWTPGFLSDRLCVKDYVIKPSKPEEKPLLIEKGWDILIPTIAIHRDPKYFPNPEKFDPERFSDENKSKIVSGSYMPFGVGPRSCIGSRFALLEMKALFCYLLKSFNIEVVDKTPIPLKLTAGDFNLNIKKGMWLGLQRRS